MANMGWLNEQQDGLCREIGDSKRHVLLLCHELRLSKLLWYIFRMQTNLRNYFASCRNPKHSIVFENEHHVTVTQSDKHTYKGLVRQPYPFDSRMVVIVLVSCPVSVMGVKPPVKWCVHTFIVAQMPLTNNMVPVTKQLQVVRQSSL